MSAAERNFRNFYVEDDPNQLADGMLPELALQAGMEFENALNAEQLGTLVGILGKNKGLRDAADVTFLTVGEMAEYAVRARADHLPNEDGSDRPIDRSLDDPDKSVPEGTPRVKTGSVANWDDFTTDYLVQKAEDLTSSVTIYMVMGDRVMDLPTELTNKNHQAFRAAHEDQLPTEQQYGETFSLPRLEDAGYDVEPIKVASKNGEEIARLFVAKHPDLFLPDRQLSAVRTSISALQLVLQLRKAARERDDGTGSIPELFMEASARPIASTRAEIDQPLQFQAPQPALRQVALDGKLLLIEQLAAA